MVSKQSFDFWKGEIRCLGPGGPLVYLISFEIYKEYAGKVTCEKASDGQKKSASLGIHVIFF